MIKMIVTDMDGTLLSKEKGLTPRTVEVLKRAIDSGVKFVVANTGFIDKSVSLEIIKLLSDAVAGLCEVKTYSTIDNINMLYDFICAGATRLGIDNGIQILKGFTKKNK